MLSFLFPFPKHQKATGYIAQWLGRVQECFYINLSAVVPLSVAESSGAWSNKVESFASVLPGPRFKCSPVLFGEWMEQRERASLDTCGNFLSDSVLPCPMTSSQLIWSPKNSLYLKWGKNCTEDNPFNAKSLYSPTKTNICWEKLIPCDVLKGSLQFYECPALWTDYPYILH